MANSRTILGNTVRALREARHWSQADLANKAGVSDMSVSRLERYRLHPQANTLRRIAAALGTTVDHLWTGRLAADTDPPADPLTDKLLTLWRALPADHRSAGIEALEYVVKLSAEAKKWTAEAARREQQVKNDSTRIRELERALKRARREGAGPGKTEPNPGSGHRVQRAG